jgi:hypothetical protein
MLRHSACALIVALVSVSYSLADGPQRGFLYEAFDREVSGLATASDLDAEPGQQVKHVTYDATSSVMATDNLSATAYTESDASATAADINASSCASAAACCDSGCGCDRGCGHDHGCECDHGCGCDSCCESHYFLAEALFWDIDQGTNRVVVLNQNTLQTLLTTDDADLGNQLGARVTFGRWVCCDVAWEASYFGFDDWNGVAVVNGNNDLRLDGDIGLGAVDDFFGANRMQIDNSVELHNIEINRVKRVECTDLSWLVGFRYINFQEDLDITGTDADNSVSNYRVGTENNLFGGQLGGIWRRHENIVGLEVFGKAGVFGTNLTQGQFIGDFGNTFTFRDTRADWSTTSYVLEGGITGLVRITDNWSARAGYNVLFIDGLVRASDQLDFTDTLTSGTLIDDSGEAYMHGANVGLEARW